MSDQNTNNKTTKKWWGMVAENKPLDTNNILLSFSSRTPWLQGDVQGNLQSVSVDTVDSSGTAINAKATTDTVIEATWLATDSNWTTAPDVQRGEIVEVIQFADKNQYFWRERGDGVVQRRLETKRLMISGSQSSGLPSTDTHYMLEISGHKGSINLSTPASNGEKTTYLLTLNGGGGMASLTDGGGQEIVMDSVNGVIRAKNSQQTFVELNQQDIILNALGDIGAVMKGSFLAQAKKVIVKADDTIEFVAGKKISFTAPDILNNGISHLNGPITQDENAAGGYNAALKGPLVVQNDVTAGKISLMNHLHDGIERGEASSNKPVSS